MMRCDYCGRELNAGEPSADELRALGVVVRGKRHYCNELCAGDARHDWTVNRAGNLKQFQPGNKYERG